jgi:Lon protease-like protein
MASRRALAMFPLGTVLLPYGILPLHIFEERYRTMMREGVEEFGVVLIERGSEVGGGDVRTQLGTVARIVRKAELPDGRWQVVAVGTPRRFRVAAWLPDDPYPVAEIDELSDTAVDPDELRALVDDVVPRVRRVLAMRAEAGEPSAPLDVTFDGDAVVASWQLALLTGMGPLDGHAVLAIDDPLARMRRIAEVVDEQVDALTFRMRGSGE